MAFNLSPTLRAVARKTEAPANPAQAAVALKFRSKTVMFRAYYAIVDDS
jgi:hypothetical protein